MNAICGLIKSSIVQTLVCNAQRMMLKYLFVPVFSSSKITNHLLHVNNDKVESGIAYDIIIGRDLMVHLVLTADYNIIGYARLDFVVIDM